MNKFLLIVISALLTACGALLAMHLSKLGTVADDITKIRATTTAICQAMADMGHPIVQVAEKKLEKTDRQLTKPVLALAPVPEDSTKKAKTLPAKAAK